MPGIKETKEIAVGFAKLVKQVVESGKDGWQWSDAFSFTDEVPAVISAVDNADEVPSEVKDMDESEFTEIVADVAAVFGQDPTSEKAKALTVSIMKFAFSFKDVYSAAKAL